ncbi:phenazine biosynthesis protein PhzE [Pseudomonas aeruginosa]|nr:phenazine biosynthesis protein PhzE [Pseudomonas aeruginosa]
MQFHPESVLTREGPRIIADLLRHALVERRPLSQESPCTDMS